MTVSERLRQEILTRDHHSCRYCGCSAPDADLTVGYVVPVALGGPHHPSNLATSCADCSKQIRARRRLGWATPPDQPADGRVAVRTDEGEGQDDLYLLRLGRDYLADVLAVITEPDPPPRIARRKTLPSDVIENLAELRSTSALLAWYLRELHDIGDYTYETLGAAIGRTGSRAGQIAAGAVKVNGTPAVEPPPPPPPPLPPTPPVVTAEIAAELAALQADARQVRGNHRRDDPRRGASETLSRRLAELRIDGATFRELAVALGVQEITVRMRLSRHGYTPSYPSQRAKTYQNPETLAHEPG